MSAAIVGDGAPRNDETRVEFGPQNIRMNGDFLTAVRRGDTRLASEIFESERRTSRGEARIQIAVPDGAPRQRSDTTARDKTSCLRGVTIGGNTSLHVVASYGHLELVEKICSIESSLLMARNTMLETPLHCAARAGHDLIVEQMISTKWGGKTALHEAAQNGHTNVAGKLMLQDPGLACIVDDEGVSPLYMAVLSGSLLVVQKFKQHCPGEVESTYYAGPNGQTALHAAAVCTTSYLAKTLTNHVRALLFPRNLIECFSGYEIARELLQWDQNLEKKADNLGATSLHYAASVGSREIAKLLLEYDPSLAYIPDSTGSYPIHVSASMGRTEIIDDLILKCPDSDELLDAKGRNFLHVAAESRKWSIVSYFNKKPELSRLMNAADFKGNTPLHLVVENGDIRTRALLEQCKIAEYLFRWKMPPPDWLHKYWVQRGGLPSPFSLDRFRGDQDQVENENIKVAEGGLSLKLESFLISCVLIATVTFAAAFTMPGGYNDDDGTPILAKQLAFKTFIVAYALAFASSVVATFWLTFSRIGTKKEHQSRKKGMSTELTKAEYRALLLSARFMMAAAVWMVVAFVSGIYVVLTPVHDIGTSICVAVSFVVCYITYFAFFEIGVHLEDYLGLAPPYEEN